MAKGKAKAEIQKNMDRTITFAKTHAASVLRRKEKLMKDWKKEDDETEKTAGGKVPETKEEHMDAREQRKGFWMDWRQMKAVAATSWNGLGITVLVYEWTAGEWKLRGRIKIGRAHV